MPVFGISTEKVDERLDPWVNTYYTIAANIAAPIDLANYLAAGEQDVHSDLVSITGAHIWQVGSPGNFSNQSYGYQGTLTSTNALPAWVTAEVTLLGEGGYPGYKRFRGRYGVALYTGPEWNSSLLVALSEFDDYLAESPLPLCRRDGTSFALFGYTAVPKPLQLGKAWYNRTTP
jgi:hypothetical protein